jgi:hypothetical protein
MSEQRKGKVLLVVLERGGVWPECVEQCRLRTSETVVLAQGDSETPSQLARRACRRLAALRETGRGVEGAAIAAGDTTDQALVASRCSISQAILRGMREATDSGKRLWLVAPERANHGTRQELLALAGELTSEFLDPELTISVKFDGAAQAPLRSDIRELCELGKRRAGS